MASYEHDRYMRTVKPVPTSLAPILPGVIASWAEEEYQRFMEKKYFEDLDGYLHTSRKDQIEANDNILQEWGKPNMGGSREF